MANPTGKRINALADATKKDPEAAETADAAPDPREYAEVESWFLDDLLGGESGPAFAAALIGRAIERAMEEEPPHEAELPPRGKNIAAAIAQITHRLAHGTDKNRDRTEAPCDPHALVAPCCPVPAAASARAETRPLRWISLGDHRPHYGDATPPTGESRGPAVSWSIPVDAAISPWERHMAGWPGDWIHVSQAPARGRLAAYTISVDTRPPTTAEGRLHVTVRLEAGDARELVLTRDASAHTVERLPADWRTVRLGFGVEPAPGAADPWPAFTAQPTPRASEPWPLPADDEWEVKCHPHFASTCTCREAGERVDPVPPGSPFVIGRGGTGHPSLFHYGGADRVRELVGGVGKTRALMAYGLGMDEAGWVDASLGTRGELGEAVQELAAHLRARGLGQLMPVAVLTGSCGASAVPIMAVLQAGCRPVHLDHRAGADQIAERLHAAAPALVLAEEALVDRLPPTGTPVVTLDAFTRRAAGVEPPRDPWERYLAATDAGLAFRERPEPAEDWFSPSRLGALDNIYYTLANDNFSERGTEGEPLTSLRSRVGAIVDDRPQGTFAPAQAALADLLLRRERERTGPWARNVRSLLSDCLHAVRNAHPYTLDPPQRTEELRPLGFAQQRPWREHRFFPAGACGNHCMILAADGSLRVEVLSRALAELVRRHAILRTTFREDEHGAWQVIHPAPIAPDLTVVDLREAYGGGARDEVPRRVADEAARAFDLERDLPLRALLLRVAEAEHTVVLTFHRASADEGSIIPIVHELSALYTAYHEGMPSPMPEPALQYADFATWQRAAPASHATERRLVYWKERLAGAPAALELPADRPRPMIRGRRRGMADFDVPLAVAAGARALAWEANAPLFTVLLTAFYVLIHRLSGQDDVVIGIPFEGRVRERAPGLIGCFADPLPLRADLSGDPTFRTLLARVDEAAREARAHANVPLERIVTALQPHPAAGHHPLFQALFALRSVSREPVRVPGLALRVDEVRGGGAAGLDLFLDMHDDGNRLRGRLEYAEDLWEPDTAEGMTRLLARVLDAAATQPSKSVSALDLMDPAERWMVVMDWSGSTRPNPRESTIHEAFARVAERNPHRKALSWDDGWMSYRELNERSMALARHLHGLGVRADEPVALVMERSPQLVAGMLGILRAGGAYVPIDAQYPRDRVAWMLTDCGARVAVAQERLAGILPEQVRALRIDDAWDAPAPQPGEEERWMDAGPEGAAYVIYTSGSTGRPKGVVVPHRAVLRLVRDADYARFEAEETWLQMAPVSFDASTLELWAPLLNGGCLAIFPPERPTTEALGAFIARHRVTSAWLTAGLFHQVAGAGGTALAGLTQLLAGGDVLSVGHVRELVQAHPGLRLINGYGPTENTTFSCCHRVTADDAERASIPIGRPVANSTAYVLDRWLQPVPVDVPGELYVGGHGVARGYLNRPALTAERFVPDPFAGIPGSRLYRTGDRARWRSDGTLEFLGRIDQQAKIRGYRVEPGEIESLLRDQPSVSHAVVLVREDVPGDRRLVAYVERAPGAVGDATRVEAEICQALRKQLPEYLLPSAIVALNALPLTPNGKVDRAALPAPLPPRTFREPQTQVERALAAIWAEVLHTERVSLDDDFFELGGHSLLATRVVTRVREELEVDLPSLRIFDAPTLAQLAAAVEAAQREAREALLDDCDNWHAEADGRFFAPTVWEPTDWSADL